MFYYFLGIKGTGLSHLAALLDKRGDRVEGEDVEKDFFNKPLYEKFRIYKKGSPLPADVDVVIYSAAFDKTSLSFSQAMDKKLPLYSYPEFISYLTTVKDGYLVSGTHGKTTTVAVASHLLSTAGEAFTSLYGSFPLSDEKVFWNDRGPFIVEACEYKDHFQLYKAKLLLINNIEFDHPDYFKDLQAVKTSFVKRVMSIEKDGILLLNLSSHVLREMLDEFKTMRPDLKIFTFGHEGNADFLLTRSSNGFSVSTLPSVLINTRETNTDILSDYLGAAIISAIVVLKNSNGDVNYKSIRDELALMITKLSSFKGLSSRCEVVKEVDGITYIDDYAHHPSEILVSYNSVKARYPDRRIIVCFMPHTASRTKALFDDFIKAFLKIPILIVQNTFLARGDGEGEDEVSRALAKEAMKTSLRHFSTSNNMIFYAKDTDTAVGLLKNILIRGDILITMGAGDNRTLIDYILRT